MTDRLNAFVVTLETRTREDDAEEIANAIRMIRGVLRVDRVDDITGGQAEFAIRAQERLALLKRIGDVLK